MQCSSGEWIQGEQRAVSFQGCGCPLVHIPAHPLSPSCSWTDFSMGVSNLEEIQT